MSIRHVLPNGFPKIVVLCGSTRFGKQYEEANLQEILLGNIVLSVGCYSHGDNALSLSKATKYRLDVLHLRKIDLADEVSVLNVGGYVGESTRREITYATAKGTPVRYLEPPAK